MRYQSYHPYQGGTLQKRSRSCKSELLSINNCGASSITMTRTDSTRLYGVYWCAFKHLVRTTNDCEGWHLRFNTWAGKAKLPVYLMIKQLHAQGGKDHRSTHTAQPTLLGQPDEPDRAVGAVRDEGPKVPYTHTPDPGRIQALCALLDFDMSCASDLTYCA